LCRILFGIHRNVLAAIPSENRRVYSAACDGRTFLNTTGKRISVRRCEAVCVPATNQNIETDQKIDQKQISHLQQFRILALNIAQIAGKYIFCGCINRVNHFPMFVEASLREKKPKITDFNKN
jgi:hypothetical protein